ncbi:hypothetical protein HEP_00504300, partial [Hepatocystis sp. ex Piliocolobus tephrosceles]
MAANTNTEIEKKFFNFYEGDNNVFYCKKYGLFLSLCENNIYCFKINDKNEKEIQKIFNAMYPTCILESCIDMDEIKEGYNKKYANKNCIFLFSSIRCIYYYEGNLFLSTDDNKIHHYNLVFNSSKKYVYNKENIRENYTYDQNTEKNIYIYNEDDDDDFNDEDYDEYDDDTGRKKNKYSYSYNWVYLKKQKLWRSDNIVVTNFHLNETNFKTLIVGYINGLIGVYNIESYKLELSYKIHSSRITNLKIYKNFIFSSDISKNIFIYDIMANQKIISYEDHMSGIIDMLFLTVPADDSKEEIKAEGDAQDGANDGAN